MSRKTGGCLLGQLNFCNIGTFGIKFGRIDKGFFNRFLGFVSYSCSMFYVTLSFFFTEHFFLEYGVPQKSLVEVHLRFIAIDVCGGGLQGCLRRCFRPSGGVVPKRLPLEK